VWLVSGAIALLAATALFGRAVLGGGGGTANGRHFQCVQLAPPNQIDDGYCARLVRDLSRRPELAAGRQHDLENRAKAVADVVGHLSSEVGAIDQVGPEHAEALQRMLVEAGFMGALVRVAEPDDPAPRGAILYVIPVGDACLLGYVSAHGGGGRQLVAHLPGGRCF